MKSWLLAAVLILSTSSAHAGELRGIIKNNQGVSRYDKGRPLDAYGFFTDALGDVPFAPEIPIQHRQFISADERTR